MGTSTNYNNRRYQLADISRTTLQPNNYLTQSFKFNRYILSALCKDTEKPHTKFYEENKKNR